MAIKTRGTQLADLVRMVGGWPIDIAAIADLLEAADRTLPNGRECQDDLTEDQIQALGFALVTA